jgi:hypothetical protein
LRFEMGGRQERGRRRRDGPTSANEGQLNMREQRGSCVGRMGTMGTKVLVCPSPYPLPQGEGKLPAVSRTQGVALGYNQVVPTGLIPLGQVG